MKRRIAGEERASPHRNTADPPGPDATAPDADDVDAVTTAMLTVSRLLVGISARSLAEADDRITVAQFRMLVVLSARGGLKLVTLAEQLGVNPSTAMRMADRLAATGLLSKEVNPANRRETALRLTDAGAGVVRDVTDRRRAEITAIVARMPAEHRRGVVAALRSFTDAGGEPPVGPGDTHPLGWT